jgi:hypothetical protein
MYRQRLDVSTGFCHLHYVKHLQKDADLTIFPYMISHVTDIEPLSSEQAQQLLLFKERAEDLSEAQRKYQNVPMSSYSTDPADRVSTFQANTPDIDHIATMAMKFRFFYADKEPTKFEKITSLLRSKAKDEWAINYIEKIAIFYKHTMKSTDITDALGSPTTNREILDLWFNSRFFHSDAQKREKLESIHQVVGKEASLFQLYIAIVECASHIKSLYVVAHKTTDKNLSICTPSHHFRRGDNA